MPLARIARLLAAQGNIRISKSGMNLAGQSSAASPKARLNWTAAHSPKVFMARIPMMDSYPLERGTGIEEQLRRLCRRSRDHVWNSGRNRLLGDASCADLGLDEIDSPTKTANCPIDFVLDRIRFCNGFSRRGRLASCVCSSSPLSVLRSIASQNISVGSFAFSHRNPFWHRWRVATGSVALARAHLWAGNVRILVPRGIR
jgi:hypothetical protein